MIRLRFNTSALIFIKMKLINMNTIWYIAIVNQIFILLLLLSRKICFYF